MKRLIALAWAAAALSAPLLAQTPDAGPRPSAGPAAAPGSGPARDLGLDPSDLRIEQSNDGGYILYIRKKADIQSVLLTESTEDPDHKVASYALRSKVGNPINGEPVRKLDGEVLNKSNLHFLMSSQAVEDKQFGQAFRIFVPYVVVYGYPWGRYGERAVQDGSFLSIRAFGLPFADYDGPYRDNPYRLKISQVAQEGAASGYNKETVKAFQDYAALNEGKVLYSKGREDTLKTIAEALNGMPDGPIDLVVCLDATGSMEKHAGFVREKLTPLLKAFAKGHDGSRFAIVQFRDYMEDFLYKVTPFGADYGIIQSAVDRYHPAGGRDTPEAVNEALYACLTELDWALKSRAVLLVGDAPPHPIPRGTVTPDMVRQTALEKHVVIDAIVLPD